MGMNMSFMGGKGLSTSQMWSLIINTLYMQFVEKDINDFDAFNVAILDIFNTINMALPGKHYDAPSHKDVMELFKQWKEAEEEAKKKKFTNFMNKNVNINKVDESMIITAIMAPPAAMVAKRTGQTMPQLKLMKAIPDVVFVPSATVLSLIAVKILTIIFMGKKASRDAKVSHMEHEVQHSNSNNIPPPPPLQQPEPASSPQPEPAPTHSQQQPEPVSSQQPEPASSPQPEPALTPSQQQSEPATSQQPHESEVADSQEHAAKENPSFCAICNRIH